MPSLIKWTVLRLSCSPADAPTSPLMSRTMSNILRLPVARDLASQDSDTGKRVQHHDRSVDNGTTRASFPIMTTEQFAAWEEESNYGGW